MPKTSAPAPHTLETYLSSRVDLAVAPLRALLHDTDIRFIRGMLKEKLASDPNLGRLAGAHSAPVALAPRVAAADRIKFETIRSALAR